MDDGKPEHSKIAREMKEDFDLDCSVDWLRTVVLTKWEQYTGIGKKRRVERLQKPAPEDTPFEASQWLPAPFSPFVPSLEIMQVSPDEVRRFLSSHD